MHLLSSLTGVVCCSFSHLVVCDSIIFRHCIQQVHHINGPVLRPQVATAGVHAFVRFGSAAFVSEKLSEFRKRPEKPIILYGALKRDCCAVYCIITREKCAA